MKTPYFFRTKGFFRGRRGLTPLVATMLLVVFSLIVGTLTMNWGKSYVENIKEDSSLDSGKGALLIEKSKLDTPLKKLQVEYLLGKVTLQEYLIKEKDIIGR